MLNYRHTISALTPSLPSPRYETIFSLPSTIYIPTNMFTHALHHSTSLYFVPASPWYCSTAMKHYDRYRQVIGSKTYRIALIRSSLDRNRALTTLSLSCKTLILKAAVAKSGTILSLLIRGILGAKGLADRLAQGRIGRRGYF